MTAKFQKTFADLHMAIAALGGAQLFTVTVLDRKSQVCRRAYSSHPLDYPVSGTKPMTDDGWSRHCIDGLQTFVANRTAEFSPYFPDHAQINRLGCHSAMNVPVIGGGLVRGTVNLLDVEGHFTPDRVRAVEALIVARQADLLDAMAAVPMTD